MHQRFDNDTSSDKQYCKEYTMIAPDFLMKKNAAAGGKSCSGQAGDAVVKEYLDSGKTQGGDQCSMDTSTTKRGNT